MSSSGSGEARHLTSGSVVQSLDPQVCTRHWTPNCPWERCVIEKIYTVHSLSYIEFFYLSEKINHVCACLESTEQYPRAESSHHKRALLLRWLKWDPAPAQCSLHVHNCSILVCLMSWLLRPWWPGTGDSGWCLCSFDWPLGGSTMTIDWLFGLITDA